MIEPKSVDPDLGRPDKKNIVFNSNPLTNL
jgi:hypothetical protein